MAEDDLDNPLGGVQCIWLPKAFGSLSMEIVDKKDHENFMNELRSTIQ
jgi:hypothetical protein